MSNPAPRSRDRVERSDAGDHPAFTIDRPGSRYIVGIDLGTTNCAVAFVDTAPRAGDDLSSASAGARVQTFLIDQWVDFGVHQRCEWLPSFHYQPTAEEAKSLVAESTGYNAVDPDGAMGIVGVLARQRGLQVPGRQVASAKSWLCHAGVDRTAAILPWQGDDDVQRLSPVEASACYLRQIRRSWDHAHPDEPLDQQDIVLTLPASFDQVARQLTIEAAALAGLRRVVPIEEPQAAFYAWLARHGVDWEKLVQANQTILVCDIGGGTTDFTLIRVRPLSAETGVLEPQGARVDPEYAEHRPRDGSARLSLHRVAVGNHLILGGDNLDLALARFAESKLAGEPLTVRGWDALRQACRVAKERMLATHSLDQYTINLPGSGSRMIGAGRSVVVTSQEVDQVLVDGFFPKCSLHDRPKAEAVGFQEFGLPFATDPAVTKHLAAFLWNHRNDGRDDLEIGALGDLGTARPDWILFNGGVLGSTKIAERLVDTIADWFGGQPAVDNVRIAAESSGSGGWRPGILSGERLDLAVAKGAAYFGMTRRGGGTEIEAKLACSFYLRTSFDPPRAVCIVPGSASPGDRFELNDRPMELSIAVPVQFCLGYSTLRLADRLGEEIEIDPSQFVELPPIRTVLNLSSARRRQTIPVTLQVELSQIGTLDLWCQSSESKHRWKLEFDVRSAAETDRQAIELAANREGLLDSETEAAARAVIAACFGEAGSLPPAKLVQAIAEAVGLPRGQWPPSLLRAIWDALIEHQQGRRRSETHEARWLNLLGYALRPGYGLAADDWRVAQTWRTVYAKLVFASRGSRSESLILWRRIAGGFTAGQQLTVYQQIAYALRGALDPAGARRGGGLAAHELSELLRLVGSLERLPREEKSQLGDALMRLLSVKKWAGARPAMLWTIGRLGARDPVYAPLNCVLAAETVEGWIDRLLQNPGDESGYALALMQCSRRVNDRYRDVSERSRDAVVEKLVAIGAPEVYTRWVEQGGLLGASEAEEIVGESLPLGLSIGGGFR